MGACSRTVALDLNQKSHVCSVCSKCLHLSCHSCYYQVQCTQIHSSSDMGCTSLWLRPCSCVHCTLWSCSSHDSCTDMCLVQLDALHTNRCITTWRYFEHSDVCREWRRGGIPSCVSARGWTIDPPLWMDSCVRGQGWKMGR